MLRLLFLAFFASMQLAANLKACSGGTRAVARAARSGSGQGGQSAEERNRAVEAREAEWQRAQREAHHARVQREIRRQNAALGLPQLPSRAVGPLTLTAAELKAAESARAQTVPVTVDLRPPEMRRGGSGEGLDPSVLRVMIDGTIMGGTIRAGEVTTYQVLPGSHTIAILNSENLPLVERTINAVLGEPQSVTFSD